MMLCCTLLEYIESRPVDIKCCLVASRNTAKLWATHGYTHVIAKLSDQTPVLATSKSGPALKPCMQLGYKILMNKKGAMVRDSNSLQSSCKADAALVDHVRLRSCFISPSIPVAPNARFSVPPMHVTGRTRGESNPTVTQLPPGTSASKSTTVATLFSWGSASKLSVLKRPPPGPPILTSFAKSNLSQAWQLAFVIKHKGRWVDMFNKIWMWVIFVPIFPLWKIQTQKTKWIIQQYRETKRISRLQALVKPKNALGETSRKVTSHPKDLNLQPTPGNQGERVWEAMPNGKKEGASAKLLRWSSLN